MLVKKLKGEEFQTDLPMPKFDRVAPANPIDDIKKAKIAIVTSGGIVPTGNPDHIESSNATKYGAYSIEGMKTSRAAAGRGTRRLRAPRPPGPLSLRGPGP